MLFVSSYKLLLFSRYLNFRLNFLVIQKKLLDQKDKVNLKIYDLTTNNWLTNIYITHITQYFRKEKQPDNDIWSVNRIQQKQYFSSEIKQKIWLGDQFQISVLSFKKAIYQVKASGLGLSFNILSFFMTTGMKFAKDLPKAAQHREAKLLIKDLKND